ncbi:MAG: glycosyl transferase [Xanthobacteraceae bacterium]|nr:MAG: glycosyl transferase [Xanthobacteraceae bacterium]
MISVVIATEGQDRAVVPTLAALVAGAAAGVVREVILVDRAPSELLRTVADATGCELVETDGACGAALAAGATRAKSDWLMFLRPGMVPEHGWVDDLARFIEDGSLSGDGQMRAALFSIAGARPLAALMRALRLTGPSPDQGLVIARALYREIGGHGTGPRAEERLLRRIGRARRVTLASRIQPPR